MNRIKADALALLIAVVDLAASKGGKKRSSSPAQEMPAEKKPKTSSVVCEGSPVSSRLAIDLTSSNETKDGAARSEPVMLPCQRWLVQLLIGLLSIEVSSCP